MGKYEQTAFEAPNDTSTALNDSAETKTDSRDDRPQPGERTNDGLAKELGLSRSLIRAIADEYREEYPQYFKELPYSKDRVYVYFSQELVDLITERTKSLREIPVIQPGEKTPGTIATELGIDPRRIKEFAEPYRLTHSEYFLLRRTSASQTNLCYSPKLVSIVEEKFSQLRNALPARKGEITPEDLAEEIGIDSRSLMVIAESYRPAHPKAFIVRRYAGAKIAMHYKPALAEILRKRAKGITVLRKNSVEGKTLDQVASLLGKPLALVEQAINEFRDSNPEYFMLQQNKKGSIIERFSKNFIGLIEEKINEIENISEPQEGERSIGELSRDLGMSVNSIAAIAKQHKLTHPQGMVMRRSPVSGIAQEYYTNELITRIAQEAKKWKEIPYATPDERTPAQLVEELKASPTMIKKTAKRFLEENPDNAYKRRNASGKIARFYSKNLVDFLRTAISPSVEIPTAAQDEITTKALAKKLGINFYALKRVTDKVRQSKKYQNEVSLKKNAKGNTTEYFSTKFVKGVRDELRDQKEALENEKTPYALARQFQVTTHQVKLLAEPYRTSNDEWFFTKTAPDNREVECYKLPLVKILEKLLTEHIASQEKDKNLERLTSDFEDLIQEIADGDGERAKKIGDIIRLLPGNAHDIILKYHPEYRSLKVGYVNKIIADYLGDFMLAQKDWRSEDIGNFKEVTGIENIHEAILFNLKNSCLTFANALRRNEADLSEEQLIERYFQEEVMTKLLESGIPELEQAVRELREYFNEVLALRYRKPDNIVASMKPGRLFPDINQLVNIKEIRDNKRMLIADEMGLGKSASAILSKEFLGLRCALIIVPSNVCDIWASYLSDKKDPDGKQIGYFQKGLAPKVLMINSFEDTQRLQNEVFDYVIVSQERMAGSRYVNILSEVDFDMMIVDEIHKLKNIESGSRSMGLLALAENIKGDDKYLALLSGTPAPNTVLDFAITLKLLYPERYKDFTNQEMTTRILYGDLIKLRTELLMRMQMKDIASSIELPQLTEEDIEIDLSLEEREIYEILLEEDELTASQKIILFRQFLLNPELLKIEADFAGSKVKALRETLAEDLKTKNKVVVFVNGYIEGVIRGDNNIIRKLGLPADVHIETIHGGTSREERRRIEKEFNTSDGKMVVFVSGQTADVGIDLSGGDETIFYNEPWSMYEKRQQRARVYREGLKLPLASKTLVARNTIEEGIRRYILAKEKAIQKLLRGIGNTEAEKRLLSNDAKHHKENVETNVELSKQYLSDWEKLLVHFGQGFQAGAKRFEQELGRMGKEYADLYQKLGRLTYQGNNARVSATMIATMIEDKGQPLEDLRILDIASGPEMLKEAAAGKLRDRIFSLDINAEHFVSSPEKRKTITGSYLDLPARNGSIDYCNLGFAYHQTSKIKYHKKNYERLQVLAEMNRVLKPGGRAVISMLHNVKLPNHEAWQKLVAKLGFRVVDEYSGEASGERHYRADFFTLEKIRDIEGYADGGGRNDAAIPKNIEALGDRLGREILRGLEMKKIANGGRLKDQRRMIRTVSLGNRNLAVRFNEADTSLLTIEQRSIEEGEALKERFGGIADIPLEEIKRIGFERKLETPGYFLLYKIIPNGGAVIIRGDYKRKYTK